MLAYVISLDGAIKRWRHVEETFGNAGFQFVRVPAVDGRTLNIDPAEYAEASYQRLHGRQTNPPEIGCYLSHIKAMRAFLETDGELALIAEDDITIGPDAAQIVRAVTEQPRFWNILRLTALSEGRPLRIRKIMGDYYVCVNTGRLKGSGAYLVDRKAATVLTKRLLPMKLPYDHALDREWFHGLAAASVIPFPITQRQKRFGSSIQTYAQPKLSLPHRWLFTYPYQAFNETMRAICRGVSGVRAKQDIPCS